MSDMCSFQDRNNDYQWNKKQNLLHTSFCHLFHKFIDKTKQRKHFPSPTSIMDMFPWHLCPQWICSKTYCEYNYKHFSILKMQKKKKTKRVRFAKQKLKKKRSPQILKWKCNRNTLLYIISPHPLYKMTKWQRLDQPDSFEHLKITTCFNRSPLIICSGY